MWLFLRRPVVTSTSRTLRATSGTNQTAGGLVQPARRATISGSSTLSLTAIKPLHESLAYEPLVIAKQCAPELRESAR
jgi:hypothetical protein